MYFLISYILYWCYTVVISGLVHGAVLLVVHVLYVVPSFYSEYYRLFVLLSIV